MSGVCATTPPSPGCHAVPACGAALFETHSLGTDCTSHPEWLEFMLMSALCSSLGSPLMDTPMVPSCDSTPSTWGGGGRVGWDAQRCGAVG